MRLRHPSDARTLLWACVLAPGLAALSYARPSLAPWLCWLHAYFALACGVIAHNHNHSPTFTGRAANEGFGIWISLFYGYPTFAWIPTHNLNHHKFVNRPGDATITWRLTRRHTLPMALVYFFVSAYWQAAPIREFIRKARERNPKLYRRILGQYATWLVVDAALLALAVALHGWATGLVTFLLVTAVPSLFALWTIMFFNYEQHVDADPWSRYDHSRSWTGRLVNFLLFNNGLHAAHHEVAGAHWSTLPELHARIAPSIDPRLIERGLTWYLVKQYVLAPFAPRFGTSQVGRPAWEAPPGGGALESVAVDPAEAGTNEERLVEAAG